MSDQRLKCENMSIEEATVSNMWEIVTTLKVTVAELCNEKAVLAHAHDDHPRLIAARPSAHSGPSDGRPSPQPNTSGYAALSLSQPLHQALNGKCASPRLGY